MTQSRVQTHNNENVVVIESPKLEAKIFENDQEETSAKTPNNESLLETKNLKRA